LGDLGNPGFGLFVFVAVRCKLGDDSGYVIYRNGPVVQFKYRPSQTIVDSQYIADFSYIRGYIRFAGEHAVRNCKREALRAKACQHDSHIGCGIVANGAFVESRHIYEIGNPFSAVFVVDHTVSNQDQPDVLPGYFPRFFDDFDSFRPTFFRDSPADVTEHEGIIRDIHLPARDGFYFGRFHTVWNFDKPAGILIMQPR